MTKEGETGEPPNTSTESEQRTDERKQVTSVPEHHAASAPLPESPPQNPCQRQPRNGVKESEPTSPHQKDDYRFTCEICWARFDAEGHFQLHMSLVHGYK